MAPSKRNHEAWTNNEPQPQTNHGIEEDQQVDVVMDVDATKTPDKPSLLICPKTKWWMHPTTFPLNTNNQQQTTNQDAIVINHEPRSSNDGWRQHTNISSNARPSSLNDGWGH